MLNQIIMYIHAKEDKMKKLHFYMLTILLLTSHSSMGQSFESNATIDEDFCEGTDGILPLKHSKAGSLWYSFEGRKPPVPFEKSIDNKFEFIVLVPCIKKIKCDRKFK